jgi:hypothetical protein
MLSLRQIEEQVISDGRVDGHELRMLREVLYADGKIDRQEADFLVDKFLHQLRGEIKQPSPEFAAILEVSREEPP